MKWVGMGLFFLAGLIMYISEVVFFSQWWGFTGLVVGFLAAPVAALFPFIYWFKVGIFPTFYFVLWGIGLLGLVFGSLLDNDKNK